MDEIYVVIAKRLREIREKRGMLQADVAAEAGITAAFLSYLEKGLKKGSLDSYYRLANALGISLSVLVKRTPPSVIPFKNAQRISLDGLTLHDRRTVHALVNRLKKQGR